MSASEPQGNGEDGFTLVEVLVSLTILSLSLSVLLGIFSQSLARAHESETAAAARVLAQSLLVRAEADRAPKPGRFGGEGENGLTWSLAVTPFPQRDDDKASLHAASIEVTVFWDGGAHAIRLSTLRLVPGPAAR